MELVQVSHFEGFVKDDPRCWQWNESIQSINWPIFVSEDLDEMHEAKIDGWWDVELRVSQSIKAKEQFID
jgi:hypothetical protein